MRPRLYDVQLKSGQLQKTLVGVLTSCRKCDVRETSANEYTLSLETTVNDDFADSVLSKRFIGIRPNPFDPMQLFEIKKTTRSLSGIITADAAHIKTLAFNYCTNGELSYEGATPTTHSGTPAELWTYLTTSCMSVAVPFTFTSNIAQSETIQLGISEAERLGDILGGKEGSFIDLFNGVYHWNNTEISFLSSRGSRRAYKIRYGQNVSSAVQTESIENTYSHILPYGKVPYGSRKMIFYAPLQKIRGQEYSTNLKKVFMLDCTSVLDQFNVPETHGDHTELYAQIREAMRLYAVMYAKRNRLGKIGVNISVDVRATLDEMSQLGLYDTVDVILDPFGTSAEAQITDVTYDALMERWKKIVLGSPTVKVADLILDKRRYNL